MFSRFILVLSVIAAVFSASCSEKDESIEVKRGYAAEIGEDKITLKEVKGKWASLSEAQRSDYKGPDAKARFVDKVIEDELLYRDALRKNIHNQDSVEKMIEDAKRNILVKEYFEQEIKGDIEVSDEEIREYYENNQDRFRSRALYKARYLYSQDSMKCVTWKKELDQGTSFVRLARTESEDELTAPDGGDLGYFNPGGYIKSVGYSEKFSEGIKDLEEGDISDVIKLEKGYCIVKVEEKTPARVNPLSEVRKVIVSKLQGQKVKEEYDRKVMELAEKYNVVNYERERLKKTTRTAEELWEIARIEEDPVERIQYYRDLVNQYPQSNYAAQALFMIGFVYSEELEDLTQAKRTFQELIRKYPESDMVGSARWMIENIYQPHPEFESIEDLKEQMKKETSNKEQD